MCCSLTRSRASLPRAIRAICCRRRRCCAASSFDPKGHRHAKRTARAGAMNYTDPAFFVFFAITFALYYSLKNARLQVALLVLASLFFYAWEAPAILGVFLCSWLITGLSSHGVLVAKDPRRARWLATLGVAINLSLLGFFKYKFLFLPAAAPSAPSSA